MSTLLCGDYRLLIDKPLIMGIVNLTPDSFSGDGVRGDVARALAHAEAQLAAGADILDIGAESSRPGAMPTPLEEELSRLMPILKEVGRWGVPVSVDTYKAPVMAEALAQGASMINDIGGMSSPEALAAVADSNCAVCVMHMQGTPGTMQHAPAYRDVVVEVESWLESTVDRCVSAKISKERLVLDPGFGFGKTLEHNIALFKHLGLMCGGKYPLLVGVSRKRMLGEMTGRPVTDRKAASIAAALMAAQRGAAIIRVHDVAETRDALKVLAALGKGEQK